jgi:hypothetical protein
MGFRQPSDAFSDVSPATKRRVGHHLETQARRVQVGIPISGDPRPYAGRRAGPPSIGAIPAVVTSAISQATGTTMGTGQVQLYYLATPDATVATADADNASVPVFNWYTGSGTIAVGKHVWVTTWSNAYWFLGGDC